jgi:hypothetical protein
LKPIHSDNYRFRFTHRSVPFFAKKGTKKASADEKSCRFFGQTALKTAETNQTHLPIPMGHFGPSTAVAQTRFVSGDFCLRPGLFAQNSVDFSKADLRLYGPDLATRANPFCSL